MLLLPEHSIRSTNVIHNGDCLRVLQSMPSNFVNCIVTSTPYFGLRDYGCAGQVGLEDTPAQFVARLVAIFREARRVLRDDGTLWLNLGDSYASAKSRYSSSPQTLSGHGRGEPVKQNKPDLYLQGYKDKDLLMIPHRVAIAMQDDGWWVRSDIVWSKPNPMPESVTDRPTKAHEYVFLLAKSERYYYDTDAIKEPTVRPGDVQTFGGNKGRNYNPAEGDPNFRNGHHQWGRTVEMGNFRNKRSVWTIANEPNSEAHFATFPQKLIEPMILAGCPVGGIVLDPFMGSGTTALVARRLNRQYVGIELNPDYVKMARRRLSEAYTPMMQLFMEATA